MGPSGLFLPSVTFRNLYDSHDSHSSHPWRAHQRAGCRTRQTTLPVKKHIVQRY